MILMMFLMITMMVIMTISRSSSICIIFYYYNDITAINCIVIIIIIIMPNPFHACHVVIVIMNYFQQNIEIIEREGALSTTIRNSFIHNMSYTPSSVSEKI